MSLDNLSREEINKMSMLELAQEILLDEKKALDFRDIFNKIAELKEYTEAQKEDFLVQFYTDLNVDGRFITLGSNMWGLKRWYPFEQIDEDIHNEPKKKKKAKKKIDDDDDLDLDLDDDLDLDLDVDDDLDDEDEDFDEIDDDFDEIDEDDDDFDDFDDEDEDIDDELEDLNEIEDEELDDELEDEDK
ncbi:DNA-directed RNA polymerase subunit delta [Ornithinibacillus scapharcae]|uniref:DNA-directed RNA polymerase subunit delta n=1 Tax=Ornithinibacillus scapharcae TaxID=1147159 RepID=UPI000225B167|nr:DNA-directed RNA polymerase subunit delta [Ornithinibacillus scapharcae]